MDSVDGAEAQPRQLANMNSFSVLDDNLDPETEMATWFCSGMSRAEVTHIAMSILDNGEAGEFIVRDKSGEPNCYGLSVKSPNPLRKEFLSFIIEKSPDDTRPGYVIRGAEALVFRSIFEMVNYFMEDRRDELGVQLVQPGDHMSTFESIAGYEATRRMSETVGSSSEPTGAAAALLVAGVHESFSSVQVSPDELQDEPTNVGTEGAASNATETSTGNKDVTADGASIDADEEPEVYGFGDDSDGFD